MRPLSILLVGDYPEDVRLGSAKVGLKLQEEFRALGHTCDAIWTTEIGPSPSWRQIRQVVSPWMAGRAIARREGTRRYDVIDAASAEGLFAGIFSLLGDRERPAVVCRSHGLEHLNYARMVDDHHAGLRTKSALRRIWYPLTRLSQVAAAARMADALLLINDVDRQFALDRGWQPEHRTAVVPHGVSSTFLEGASAGPERRGAGLLFCGTWDFMKGTPYLVDAMRLLHASGEPVRLTVLGPGVPADAVLASFDERVRPFVTVIDRAPEDRVMAEYRRHDALVFTSTYEGFGMVVIEAMSQRLPVVATPAGCAATLVRDGETGYAIPARDAAALAAAIRRVLADPAAASKIACQARAAVAGMTWRATAERTLDVYDRAMAEVKRR